MERSPPHQVQVHPQRYEGGGIKTQPHKGPTASKVLAVITLLPVGGTLLMLAGITLVGTLIGMAVTTPLLIICSPVLVPAAITVALAVTAFLASGVFGLTGLTSVSCFFNYLRQATASIPDQFDQAKRHMQDIVAQAGQKTKEVGQTIQTKAQEGGRTA